MRKFETHVPVEMWERYEAWADEPGRGKIFTRQIGAALFRLFLAAPEDFKILAFYGTEDRLRKAFAAQIQAREIVDAAAADAQELRQKEHPPKRRRVG